MPFIPFVTCTYKYIRVCICKLMCVYTYTPMCLHPHASMLPGRKTLKIFKVVTADADEAIGWLAFPLDIRHILHQKFLCRSVHTDKILTLHSWKVPYLFWRAGTGRVSGVWYWKDQGLLWENVQLFELPWAYFCRLEYDKLVFLRTPVNPGARGKDPGPASCCLMSLRGFTRPKDSSWRG